MACVGRGMAVAVLVVVSCLVVEAVHVPAQENTQVHFNRISKQVESMRHALEEHEKLNVRVVSRAAQAYLEESAGDGDESEEEIMPMQRVKHVHTESTGKPYEGIAQGSYNFGKNGALEHVH